MEEWSPPLVWAAAVLERCDEVEVGSRSFMTLLKCRENRARGGGANHLGLLSELLDLIIDCRNAACKARHGAYAAYETLRLRGLDSWSF